MPISGAHSGVVREVIEERRYPAQWSLHGRSAGPRRNQRMLDEGRPDLVLAFPGARGTADLVRRAQAAGVLVAHLDSEVFPPLSLAVQQVLEAETINEPLRRTQSGSGAARDEEDGVTDACDIGR